jgi:hypothetical protein
LRAAERIDHTAKAEQRHTEVKREQPDQDRRPQQQPRQADRPQPNGGQHGEQQQRRGRECDGASSPAAGIQLPEPRDEGRQERGEQWDRSRR